MSGVQSFEPNPLKPIFGRIRIALLAWVLALSTVALGVAILQVFPAESMSQFMIGVISAPVRALVYLPIVFLFGAFISIPFFVVGLVLALLFERFVLRFGYWLASFVVVLALIVRPLWIAAARDNPWAREREYWEKVGHFALEGQTFVFAVPIGLAIAFYVWRLRKAS